ncbi:MAG: ABC transporter substrate-binding protein [Halanaeroarchaeum sp.]
MSGIDRRNFLKGAGVAGIAGLAGCTGGGGDTTTTTESSGGGGTTTTESNGLEARTLKLGLLLPETGDLGQLGQPMVNAGELAVKMVNDAGMAIDVDHRVEDTQTQQSAGISAANSLVNAGYPAVVGPASSGINIPVSKQVFIPNGVVGISPSSTALSVTSLQDDDYIFRTAPSDALQGKVLAQIAAENQNHETAATMYVNNDYGQQLSNAFANAFEGKGGTVQAQVSFEKEQSSYTSRLQQALGKDPGVLIVIGYPASGIQIFKDYYADYGAGRNILITDGLKKNSLPQQVGHDMTNVGGSSPLAAGPAVDAFTQAYKNEYGADPGVFTSHSFDAAAVVMLANAAAGENTGSAVRDQMRTVANPGGADVTPENLAEGIKMAAKGEGVQYKGASSSVDFDENGDMKAVTYEFFKFKQGGGVKTQEKIQFGG